MPSEWIPKAWAAWLLATVALTPGGASALQQGPEPTLPAGAEQTSFRLAPAPGWVAELERDTPPTGAAADAPVQYLALDEQVRFEETGTESYRVLRGRVQTQGGLAELGRVAIAWDPARERVTANRVRIVRDGRVIDVLETQGFEVLRRETNLEAAMLDGWLTASLQISDLRVGDIVETAFTTRDMGGVLAPHREHMANPDYDAPVGRYRLLVSWPADRPVSLRASPWSDVAPRRRGDRWEYRLDVEDLQPLFRPGDLPRRFHAARLVQFTDYADWKALRQRMVPLYETAATLEPGSPLMAEIERIRAAHATPADQAAAALRLVQDEVRYLAISIGEAGYVPASADAVWRARFGDCKGKTALLLALLRGLGIEAEAALVSLSDGDGLDERLPLVGWFDHVIVKVTLEDGVHWIDGTGVGDRRLADLSAPPYRWSLVLDGSAGGLERIEVKPAHLAAVETLVEVDATGGLDAEAPFRAEVRYTGNTALAMRDAVSRLSREQLLAQFTVGQQDRVMRLSSVDSQYDDDANRFTLIYEGRARMGWARGATGRRLALQEVGFRPASAAEREGLLAEWADEPYLINYPLLARTTSRIRLPQSGEGFRLEANDRAVTFAGIRYDRRTTLDAGVVEAVATLSSLTPEVSAAEMAEARRRAERDIDRVPQILAPATALAGAVSPVPADASTDIEAVGALADVGDIDGALALLDARVEADPADAEALRFRAGLRADRFEVAEAEADYGRALDLDPADSEALKGLGLLLLLNGRPSEALVNFAVALRLDPADLMSLTGRGAAYHRIGNWERSLADYRAARAISPGSQTALWGEARALIRLGRLPEARTLVGETLDDNPTDRAALKALVEIEEAAGRPGAALGPLDRAAAQLPDDPMLLTQRAGVRARSGDLAGAREDFRRVRDLGTTTPWILSHVCWRQAVEGMDLEQALADCDAAMSSVETGPRIGRAFVLMQLGREAEALEIWRTLDEDRQQRAVIAYGRGLTRLAQGDGGGRGDIDQALLWDPDVTESFRVFLGRRPDLLAASQGGPGLR